MDEIFSDRYYLVGQIRTHRPDWRHRQRPDNAANNLIAVTEGVLYMEEAGVRYTVGAGEMLLLEHGLPSAGYRASQMPTSFYYLLFNGPIPLNIPKHFTPRRVVGIYELYELLLKYRDAPGYPPECRDYMARLILAETGSQASTDREDQQNALVGSILEWVKKSRDRDISINELARHFHYSSDYVSKLFFAQEGVYLRDYICATRLSYIEELLSEAKYTLAEVAEICGFINVHSFLKYYKYHRRITPSEYKKHLYTQDGG